MRTLLLLFVSASLLLAEMVSVPGGTFTMGGGVEDDEKPAHKVTVKSFKMDKSEVTNAAYNKCVASGKCKRQHYSDGKCYVWSNSGLRRTKVSNPAFTADGKPATCVSYNQAKAYCRSVGKRLPTEAEWEFAATKAGTRKYSSGGSVGGKAAYGKNAPAKVGSFPAGAYQLKDMNGNVWEWVHDRYERDYYKYSPQNNPKGASTSRFRTIRGGGWYSSVKQLRSRNRHWFAPEAGEVSIGFRCVK